MRENTDTFHAVYMMKKLVVNRWWNLFRPIPGQKTPLFCLFFFFFFFFFENFVSKTCSFIGSSIYRPWLVILLTWWNILFWRIAANSRRSTSSPRHLFFSQLSQRISTASKFRVTLFPRLFVLVNTNLWIKGTKPSLALYEQPNMYIYV